MEKRILLLCCALMLCIFPAKSVAAEETATCEDVIQEIVDAMDERNWEVYLTHLEESKRDWMQNHYFAELTEDSMGINQVVGAQLRDTWLLDYKDFCWDISYNEYDIYEEVGDENIFGYLVGIDYDVTTENVYFYQGLNYNLWIFAFDGNDYKLVEFTIPRIDLIEKYVTTKNSRGILSEEEQKALDAAESRAHGNPVNLEGVSLWNDLPTTEEENGDDINISRSASQDIVPTNIRILWRAKEGGDDEIYTRSFRDYCKQVLPHEWFASWDSAALFTGAKCVKTFSWYYCCYPHASDGSYDINSAQQSWTPDHSTNTATNDAINSIFRSGMFNPSGKLFPAYYGRGIAGEAGRKGQGRVSQYGSQYLAQQGWSSTEILRYYYDNSDLFSGEIQFKTVTEF